MELKSPTDLLSSPRMSGGLLYAVAKTTDDRAASVIWDFDTKSWVFAKDLKVGVVLAAAPAPASALMAAEVPASNIVSSDSEA